eukprot:GAHX01000327.1.p1 GENE.GAHX01000327.1~~GAHX01000327.1.p1  ORF type:complete len:390 (-),score=62.76 GAHX01000327.1:442-1569(-)
MKTGAGRAPSRVKALIKEFNLLKENITTHSKKIDKNIKARNTSDWEDMKVLMNLSNNLLQLEMEILLDEIPLKKPLPSSFISTLLFNPSYKLLVKFSIVAFEAVSKATPKELTPYISTKHIDSIAEVLQLLLQNDKSAQNEEEEQSYIKENKIVEVDSLKVDTQELQVVFNQITMFVAILLIKFPNHLVYISSDEVIKRALDSILENFYFKYIYPVELKEINNLLTPSFEIRETESSFMLRQFIDKDSFVIEIAKKDLYPLSKGKATYKYSNSTIKNSVKNRVKSWTQLIGIKRHNGLRNTTQLVYTIEVILKDLKRIFGSLKECTICYCIMSKNELPNVSCVSCRNMFHKTCIETWLDSHAQDRKCPYCREEFY